MGYYIWFNRNRFNLNIKNILYYQYYIKYQLKNHNFQLKTRQYGNFRLKSWVWIKTVESLKFNEFQAECGITGITGRYIRVFKTTYLTISCESTIFVKINFLHVLL